MAELAPYLRGWRGYFGFCETPEVLISLIRWVRLRLRAALWRQWKTPRRRRAALFELGVRPRLVSNTAGSGLGPWSREPEPCLLGFPMPTSNRLVFLHSLRRNGINSRTAVYGPVRTVVWQGSAGDRRPYADQVPFPPITHFGWVFAINQAEHGTA